MSKKQQGFGHIWVLVVAVAIIILAVGGYVRSKQPPKPGSKINVSTSQDNSITITTNPVDLSQISQISKFRSCFGHDFSGGDTQGIVEGDRSMKHYFQTAAAYQGVNKVKVVAPFDGSVAYANQGLDAPYGWQIALTPTTNSQAEIIFFHLDPSGSVGTAGTVVKAGQLLGYTHPPDGSTFDIAYGWPAGSSPIPETLDSIFNHMSPAVLAQYKAHGLTPDNAIISKAQRDAQTCNYPPDHGIGSPLAGSPDNWVILQ